jgi:cell division protein FtsW
MMEALRFPWGGDDEERRGEVAPSAFRPHKQKRGKGRVKSQATHQATRRPAMRPSSGSRRSRSVAASASIGQTLVRPVLRETARDRKPGVVVQGPQRERHEPDYLLMVAALGLSAIGLLMVYSSGGVDAASDGSIFDALKTQLLWAIAGAVALIVVMRLDYRYWRLFSVLGFAVAVGLLILVLMPPIPSLIEPVKVGGASRWLTIGSLPPFHPAELAKLALIVFLAHWLASRGTEVGSFRRGMLPFLMIAGLVIGLVVLEPDLGTTGVITLTAFTMFFVAGGSVWQLLMLVPLGLAAVGGLLLWKPYQMERWTTFLDPWAAPADAGYQTIQGIYALALGGLFGEGLGESQRPYGLDLPAAENDFIFAVLGQEFGMVGGLAVIGLFLLLAYRGIRVAMNAPDTFGGLLALGITSWLAFQAFINIGVVVNLLPLTGLPLPFLSDGGTSLVVSLAAVGILLSISRETVSRGSDAHEDPGSSRWHRWPHLPRLGRGDAASDPAR